MLIALAWFTEKRRLFDATSRGLHSRLRRFVAARSSPSWRSELVEGPGWGMFATAVAPGRWRWDLLGREGDLLVATVGLPVGLDPSLLRAGPPAVGKAALEGRSALDGVVPPFGVLATDGSRFVARQDWFGMAPLYVYRSGGVVAFSNRPLLLPYALGDEVRPDRVGWAHYAACDAFAGPTSPVEGVTPLPPGQLTLARRGRRDRWRVTTERGASLDDAAVAGLSPSAAGDIESRTLESFSRVSASLSVLWPEPLRCGLSGGRDSRLLAANLIANELRADFYTNLENPAEGDTARELIRLAGSARNRELEHKLVPPRVGGGEDATGLAQRLEDHFLEFDFSSRRQYVIRKRRVRRRQEQLPRPSINGGIGDIAWGIWVPAGWDRPAGTPPEQLYEALWRGLASKAGGPLEPRSAKRVDRYLAGLIESAAGLGLDQAQSLAWMYCASRARTWATARNHWDQVLMYATPEFVTAVIALPLADLQGSHFHRRLTARLLPEWADVSYVHGSGPASPAKPAAIWDGDGLQVLSDLAEATTSELTGILDRAQVDATLARVRAGSVEPKKLASANRLLATFAVLATAERELSALNASRK